MNNRKIMDIINNDREVITLRMQSEDLINNIGNMSEEDFSTEANRIKSEIDKRISILYREINQ